MARRRVLVVDDEEGILEICADVLKKFPETEIITEQNSVKAAELLKTESFDLLITDIKMPNLDGIELLEIGRQFDPDLTALILTAYPTFETAVDCMKLGAADFLVKPFIPENLLCMARSLLNVRMLHDENRLLEKQRGRGYVFDEIVAKSEKMQVIFETIEQVAKTDVDVLISGETGVGKELVARSIHKRSSRSGGRFVPVDCGAIPENLLESELFGHERGAFTDAHTRGLGLLEFAHKGTFFLDEVGELPLRLQTKLLRALQERKIRRVGGKQEIDVDVRVVAATNRDLAKEIQERRFREEFYYRINVVRIDLPPLRDRPEDIRILIEHFMRRYSREFRRPKMKMDPDVMEILGQYRWPGNVRELQNIVKRCITMSREDMITPDDLPQEITTGLESFAGQGKGTFFQQRSQHISKFEMVYLADLLEEFEGDVTRAAQKAEIPRGTFYRLLKKYDLYAENFRSPGKQ